METWPEDAKAKIVLEVDGEPFEQAMQPGQKLRHNLQAGVRAFTLRTNEDHDQLQFRALRVEGPIEK